MGNLIVQYAMRFVGTPYKWGGDDPMLGLDCSGFALEILAAFGFKHPDMTAASLYIWCKTSRFRDEVRPGALVFFGKDGAISHVAVAINSDLMIEAGGGGSKTTDREAAARDNAYVRIRPIRSRKDFVGAYYPPYRVSLVVV